MAGLATRERAQVLSRRLAKAGAMILLVPVGMWGALSLVAGKMLDVDGMASAASDLSRPVLLVGLGLLWLLGFFWFGVLLQAASELWGWLIGGVATVAAGVADRVLNLSGSGLLLYGLLLFVLLARAARRLPARGQLDVACEPRSVVSSGPAVVAAGAVTLVPPAGALILTVLSWHHGPTAHWHWLAKLLTLGIVFAVTNMALTSLLAVALGVLGRTGNRP